MKRLLALLLLVSCQSGNPSSGSTDGGGGAATCVETFGRLCQRGADCAGGAACRMAYGGGDGGAAVSLSWNSAAECQTFYQVFGCQPANVPAGFDFAACQAAIGAASCTTTMQGGAIQVPSACNTSKGSDAGAP